MTSTSLLSYARRLGAALVSLLVLGLVASLVALAPPPAGAATTSLSARPAVAGERLVLTGSVPATRARPVTLQRRAAARWVRVAGARTTARGAFRLVVRQPSVATAYRVLAPAVAGRRATVSRAVRAVPVVQRVTLTTTGPLEVRSPLAVHAVFAPARPGRPWRVERRVDGRWQVVAAGTQPRSGRTTAVVRTPRTAGRFAVRVTAPAWRGAAAVTRASTVDVQAVAPRRVGAPRLVTVGPGGAVGDTAPGGAGTSDGGRWVTFESDATNLVPGSNGDATQVYLRDTRAGTTTRISSAPDGGPGDGYSYDPVISGDGRYVSFTTTAMLLPNDTNRRDDVYLYDRKTSSLSVVSQHGSGFAAGDSFGQCLSTSGRYVAFSTFSTSLSGAPGQMQVVRLDRRTGTLTTVSRNAEGGYGNFYSSGCRVADDGSVLFSSSASNLVPGDTENTYDLFLWRPMDGITGLTTHTPGSDSTHRAGGFGLTADGRTVTLVTTSRLTAADTDGDYDLYRYVVDADPALELIELDGAPAAAFVSDDGTRFAYETAFWRGEEGRPWGPTVPRVTESPGAGVPSGPVAVLPDGTETDADTRVLAFSSDGTAVLFTTADPGLAGRPTGGVPQLVVQRLEPLD